MLFKGSIGRTDLLKEDVNTPIDSIKNNLSVLSDELTFIADQGAMPTPDKEIRYYRYVGNI